jgi:hypothetical protein
VSGVCHGCGCESSLWNGADDKFLLQAIKLSTDDEILLIIIDTVRREADAWTSSDRWPVFSDALVDRFNRLLKRGRHHAPLAALLLEIGQAGRLAMDDIEDIEDACRQNYKVSCRRRWLI